MSARPRLLKSTGQAQRAALIAMRGGLLSHVVRRVKRLTRDVGSLAQATQALNQRVREQAGAVQEQLTEAEAIGEHNGRVVAAAKETTTIAQRAAQEMADCGAIAQGSIVDIQALVETATSSADQFRALMETLREASQVAGQINSIAAQTNLLALNARIEAARAGDTTLGFAVVAEEVRELAAGARAASNQIEDALNGLLAQAQGLIQRSHTGVAQAQAAQAGSQAIGEIVGGVEHSMGEIAGDMGSVQEAAEQIDRRVQDFVGQMTTTAQGVQQSSGNLNGAQGRLAEVRTGAERLHRIATRVTARLRRMMGWGLRLVLTPFRGARTAGSRTGTTTGPISEIAHHAGVLALELVDVTGHIEEVSQRFKEQAQVFASVQHASAEIGTWNERIGVSSRSLLERARGTRASLENSRDTLDASLKGIEALVDTATLFSTELEGFSSVLQPVAAASKKINAIGNQTHMLALNAEVRAARAGEQGRAFSVVAGEVRELAKRARQGSEEITRTMGGLTAEAKALSERSAGGQAKAEAVKAGSAAIRSGIDTVARVLMDMAGQVDTITYSATAMARGMNAFQERAREMEDHLHASTEDLQAARDRLNTLSEGSESLLNATALSGEETVDSACIRIAQSVAARIAARFEEALARGELTEAQLFDERYEPVPDTNPQQHLTDFVGFTDRVLPTFQEPVLGMDPRIVFCAAVDRKGFLPTHNLKYCHPQRPGEVEWNTANCRNRRIFNDRVGLAAGNSQDPFRIQVYRRAMGGGVFVMMKDVSAPIQVRGRHWGGFRIGYQA